MKSLWRQLTLFVFRAISGIRRKSKCPEEARIYNFVKDFLDDSGVSDNSFWERKKTLKDLPNDQTRPTKRGGLFFLLKSLHEPSDNNSNTINTSPTVSLPSNTPVCPKYDTDVSLLSEGINSLEQFFDTEFQSLTQMSPVKSTRNGRNTDNESDIYNSHIKKGIY